MSNTPLQYKKRLIIAFTIFCGILALLCVRVGYIQVVKSDFYEKKATRQQMKDEIIQPKRGDIVDRNGNQLAVSTLSYSVWVRPALIKGKSSKEEGEAKLNQTVEGLSKVLGMDEKEMKNLVNKDMSLIKVAKYLEKDKADAVRNYVKEHKIEGVSISEETKRYYPLGVFASQILGSVTDDNNGLSGLEQYYNRYLRGVPSRWIQNKDVNGRGLSYGLSENYVGEDGATLVLTIDMVIQNYAEKACVEAMKTYKARRVSCLVMDPSTGEILAVASTPSFDPNNSRIPIDPKELKAFKNMKEDAQLKYMNKMWRSPLFNDTYVPGSTLKILTTAMALEEDLTTSEEHFFCKGYIYVAGVKLKCWRYEHPHGDQTLVEAVGNSCNPVFVQLAQRIGIEKYYAYLSLFGMPQKTGVDYPGEASAQMQSIGSAGPVGLATMGFGQGIAVTPIQVLTAISSLGNQGMLMQPHLVKAIKSSDGKVLKNFKPVQVRRTVSAATSKKMLDIMEYVVEKGGGSAAKVPGYRVGGKTSTANIEADKDKIIASFAGIAPLDNPKIAVLFIVEEPEGAIYGSTVAAPGAGEVIKNSLRYLQIKSEGDEQK